MDSKKRALLRIALAVQKRLAQPTAEPIKLPRDRWRAILAMMDRASFCREHGMQYAEQVKRDELRWHLDCLSREAHAQAQAIAEAGSVHRNGRAPTSSLADIYRDLISLNNEFAKVTFDLRRGLLSVTTEPIVLHDVRLGPFRIELNYRRIDEYEPYRVVAVQPNTPPGYPDITHPHVKDDSLCEGDASEAIKAALKGGRLCDFFLLVTQVLSNLGDSVHVSLSQWNSSKCEDCGDAVAEDEALLCRTCGSELCGSCASWCPHCESDYCSGCISACDACDSTCCLNCLSGCSNGGHSVCPTCNKGKMCSCPNNQEYHEDEKMDEEESPHDAACDQEAQLTIQPDSVGQAAVLA